MERKEKVNWLEYSIRDAYNDKRNASMMILFILMGWQNSCGRIPDDIYKKKQSDGVYFCVYSIVQPFKYQDLFWSFFFNIENLTL